jgi:O-6-methylguanine DNA methyltransferase
MLFLNQSRILLAMMQKNSTPPFFEKTFSSGPRLSLHFSSKLELVPSSCFSVHFHTELPLSFSQELVDWLLAYSLKQKLPRLSLPRQNLPDFSWEVLSCLKELPFGSTLSYQQLAEQAGSPKAARAVGTICRLNPWPLFIPCHRILPKQKETIGKYAFGSSLKRELLEYEGII